jgi:hypothetical protein
MMKLINPFILFLLTLSVTNGWALPVSTLQPNMPVVKQQVTPITNSKISYKITMATDHSFGYDIYRDGRLLVHQPVIPCVAGTKGFRNRSDAQKTALLVIQKIRHGIMPPTVSKNELQAIGVVQ